MSAYPLSFATLGLTQPGSIFDGRYSTLYTDSARTTEATTVGSDPLGAYLDMSGTGNHGFQSSSPNKGILVERGGVKGMKLGTITAARRWMELLVNVPAQFTLFAVERIQSGTYGSNIVMLEPASPYLQVYRSSNQGQVSLYDNGANIATASQIGSVIRSIVERAGTGANQTKLTSIIGSTLTATGTSGSTYTGKTAQIGGWSGANYDPTEIYFFAYYEGAVTAGQKNAFLAEMATIAGLIA